MTATGRPFSAAQVKRLIAETVGIQAKRKNSSTWEGGPSLHRAPGTLAAFACACTDEIPLELRQATEHGQHYSSLDVVVSAHVSPSERNPGFLGR